MSSLVSKTEATLPNAEDITNNNTTEDQDDPETLNSVTKHVRLKHAHSTETLAKEEVLRRIRQRKGANKVRATVQALVGALFSSKTDTVSIRWVDDAFAAP